MDDNEEILNSLKIIFETEQDDQFIVITAKNGSEGLEKFKLEQPDIAIIDLMMPDLDGFHVMSEIKKTRSKIPIIILTAKSDTISMEMTKTLYGADKYITKPFNIDELIVTVKELLKKGR